MERTIFRSSLLVTGLTVFTAAVNVLSQAVIAWLFGVSAELDAYLTAAALPFAVTGTVSATIGYTQVPILAAHRGSQQESAYLRNACFFVVAVVAAGTALVCASLSSSIVSWSAPNLTGEKLLLAANLQRWFWVATGFSFVTSYSTAIFHNEKRFGWPAASTLLPPLCIILSGVFFAPKLGITSLAIGYAAGVFLQCALLLAKLRIKLGMPRAGFFTLVGKFASGIPLVLVSLLPFTLLPAIDAFWASRLPDGSLSYLGYANRIVIGLTGITIQGVAVVLFPFFSENAAGAEFGILRSRIMATLRFVFLIMVPMAGLLAVLRHPILTLLFQRGSFDQAATAGVARVLPWYLIGMIGMAAMNIVGRGFYAISNLRTPALIGLGSLVFYAILSGILTARYSYVGIGIAYAISWSMQFVIATAYLGLGIGPLWRTGEAKFLLKLVGVTALAAAILRQVAPYFSRHLGSFYQVLYFGLSGLVLVGLLASIVFDIRELRSLRFGGSDGQE